MKKRFGQSWAVWGWAIIALFLGAALGGGLLIVLLKAFAAQWPLGWVAAVAFALALAALGLVLTLSEIEQEVRDGETRYFQLRSLKPYYLIVVAVALIIAPALYHVLLASQEGAARTLVGDIAAADLERAYDAASGLLSGLGLLLGGGAILFLLKNFIQVSLREDGRRTAILLEALQSHPEGVRFFSNVAESTLGEAIDRKTEPCVETLDVRDADKTTEAPRGSASDDWKARLERIQAGNLYAQSLVIDLGRPGAPDDISRRLDDSTAREVLFVKEGRRSLHLAAYAAREDFDRFWRGLDHAARRDISDSMTDEEEFIRAVDRALYLGGATHPCAPLLAFPARTTDTVWRVLGRAAGRGVRDVYILSPKTGWPQKRLKVADLAEWTFKRAARRQKIAGTWPKSNDSTG